MSGMHLSKEFFELLKAIGESKSKQEEDRIIQREITTLKKKMETGNTGNVMGGKLSNLNKSSGVGGNGGGAVHLGLNRKKAKEFLIRLLYVGKRLSFKLLMLMLFLDIVTNLILLLT